MLCNLTCLKARLRLRYQNFGRHSSSNLISNRKISWNGESKQKYVSKCWRTDSFLQTSCSYNTHFIYPSVDPEKYYVSGCQKYLFFSTRTDISGVIFIYTWDILFGTPCIHTQQIHPQGNINNENFNTHNWTLRSWGDTQTSSWPPGHQFIACATVS